MIGLQETANECGDDADVARDGFRATVQGQVVPVSLDRSVDGELLGRLAVFYKLATENRQHAFGFFPGLSGHHPDAVRSFAVRQFPDDAPATQSFAMDGSHVPL